LSEIDITRATVQIDGRRICATFVLARPPADADFQLTISLRDTTTSRCCASLRFRRTAGQLEVGHEVLNPNGVSELRPVAGAGAAFRGTTLVITGTLPPPSAWYGTRRMPSARHIGWSTTTRYAPGKYGPYYGDWLPRHEPVAQPMIRHRDGAIVRPGALR
jgi:hypothetical protein